MSCYIFQNNHLHPYINSAFVGAQFLPNNHIVLHNTPVLSPTLDLHRWHEFFAACHELRKEISAPYWVFVDAAWDPVHLDNNSIVAYLNSLRDIFCNSRVLLLSSRAQHFYDHIPGCLYWPMFAMLQYHDLYQRPKTGRIGCLNRRNAPHRVWLMHHLLQRKLLDPNQDSYSVSFTNLWDGHYIDVDSTLGIDWFNAAQMQWPTQIQTHPDNFPNDYGTVHPAWHTGVVIITETEVDHRTLICEKTAKGILSRSCFSVYMHDVGYCVLEDLGFAPRFFPAHAQEFNIKPIVKICKQFDTAADAIAYSHDHQCQIDHNFEWFGHDKPIQTRPWFARWYPKLLDTLSQQ